MTFRGLPYWPFLLLPRLILEEDLSRIKGADLFQPQREAIKSAGLLTTYILQQSLS